MSIAKDTKTAILDAAQDMVQRQSISGVSFQELAKRIGIKKGSMYYHFETKDELSIALLERASHDLKASFKRGESKSPQQQLNYFFSIYRRFIGPDAKMCPGGAFAGEWGKLSEPVQSQVNKLIKVQIQGVEKIIAAGLKNGEFNGHGQSANELALWLVSCLQGALLTSRVTDNQKSFDCTLDVIGNYLSSN